MLAKPTLRGTKVSEAQEWVIQTDDLQVGTTLSFDLTDASGQVLLKAGTPITERIKERLIKKNIQSVTVRGESTSETVLAESILLDSYDVATVKAVQASMENAQRAVLKLTDSLKSNSSDVGSKELQKSVNEFIENASKDITATLAVLAVRAKVLDTEFAEKLSRLSTKRSMLAVAMSVVRKDEIEETIDIGMAGLLHDCSLVLHPEWFQAKGAARDEDFFTEYRRHPLESVELLPEVQGISKNVVNIITQVHEQADGSGFPRGLRLENTLLGATTLCLVDAYYALTEPWIGPSYVPADALAYLCYHTAQGKFCRNTLKLMIDSMSIYPIGSTVVLDDDTKAIVILNNSGEPMNPVVRLLNKARTRIDLTDSKRTIVAPLIVPGEKNLDRIKKPQMQEILWRIDR